MRRKEKKRLKEEMQKNHLWGEFVRLREQLKRDGVLPDKRWTQAAVTLGVIEEEPETDWPWSCGRYDDEVVPFDMTPKPFN